MGVAFLKKTSTSKSFLQMSSWMPKMSVTFFESEDWESEKPKSDTLEVFNLVFKLKFIQNSPLYCNLDGVSQQLFTLKVHYIFSLVYVCCGFLDLSCQKLRKQLFFLQMFTPIFPQHQRLDFHHEGPSGQFTTLNVYWKMNFWLVFWQLFDRTWQQLHMLRESLHNPTTCLIRLPTSFFSSFSPAKFLNASKRDTHIPNWILSLEIW